MAAILVGFVKKFGYFGENGKMGDFEGFERKKGFLRVKSGWVSGEGSVY